MRVNIKKYETFMIASNTHWNDYIIKIEMCMGEWLDGCMRNGLKRFSKSNHTTACGVITYNHTAIHSYLAMAQIGITNR